MTNNYFKMKQKILLLLLCTTMLVNAQTSKDVMTDSIATNIMNGKWVNLIGTTLEIKDMYHTPNILATEIALYKTQKDTLVALLKDIYYNNSVEELKTLNEFVKSYVYKCIVSYDIQEEYMPNLIASAMYNVHMQELKSEMTRTDDTGLFTEIIQSAFAGTQVSKKYFKIKDKEFVELFNRYYEKQNKDAIANILTRYIAKAFERRNLEISRTKVLKEAQILYSSTSCNTFYKYLTKEEMQYLIKFYETSIGQKFTDIKIHNVLNMYVNKRIATVETEEIFKTNLKNITEDYYKTYIAERKRMNIMPFEPIADIQTIEFKKGTYTGAVLNGKPHGQGTHIDKKGVKYVGNFVEGKMHGCITVYQLNGDSLLEMWANGKKMKIQSIAKPTEGVINAPPTYTDEDDMEQAMGFGYERKFGVTEIGMFVDDELHGNGIRYDDDMESTGVFKHGRLAEGTIIETKTNNEVIRKGTFKDIKYGKNGGFLCRGIYNSLNLIDSSKVIFIGDNINGWYTGDGEYQYHNNKRKYSYKRKGHYAYSELFGEGVELYESNGTYKQLYEGEFINTKKNGRGKLIVEAISTHCIYCEGMTFYCENDKDIILLEGIFKNDDFVEGKITQSCGSIYEGTFKGGKLIKGTCKAHKNSNLIEFGRSKEYEGEVLNGYPHGEGKLIGLLETYEGTFEKGELVKGIIKNIKGKVIRRVNNK